MGLLLQYLCVAGYVAWLAQRYYGLLDLGKQLPASSSCQLLSRLHQSEIEAVPGEVIPVEDLVLYRPGVLLGGAGDTIACMRESPEKAKPGYMLAVDVRGGSPEVSKLAITGLPDGMRFQPHGIFYSKKSERLYAVNHGGVTGGGSRVEMFDVKEGENGVPTLHWRMSIGGGEHFPNVALNSVVEGVGDEIFVTQFQNFAIPAKGEHHPANVWERLGRVGQFMLELLAVGGLTGVHHCTFDPARGDSSSCREVASGFVHANGLTINAERTKLYVNDPVKRSVTVYSVHPGGDIAELSSEHIALPHAVDNIHIDEQSGHMFAGTIPLLHEQLDKKGRKHGTFLDISSSDDLKFDTFSDVVVHDGQALNQISACYKVSDLNQKVWGVCGSPLGAGLLVCEL